MPALRSVRRRSAVVISISEFCPDELGRGRQLRIKPADYRDYLKTVTFDRTTHHYAGRRQSCRRVDGRCIV
jgi:hypothetical protein